MKEHSRITPHLWYDKEAKEAAGFYCSLFSDSQITHVTTLHDTPSGDTDIVIGDTPCNMPEDSR